MDATPVLFIHKLYIECLLNWNLVITNIQYIYKTCQAYFCCKSQVWNTHFSFTMHCTAVTAVTMHYADQMYFPMVGMISTQRESRNNYMYIFTKLGIITKLYYGQKPCHQPTMKIRNSKLCLPQISLYYIKVMEHKTTAVGAQVTYKDTLFPTNHRQSGYDIKRGLLCDNWQSNPVTRIADFPIKLNTERCLKTSICELETNRAS